MSQLLPVSFRDRELKRGDLLSPADFEEPAAFRPGRSGPTPNLISDYLRTLARWRAAILLAAVLGGLLSLSLNLGVMPVFEARTSLDIQSLNGDFMNMRNVSATGGDTASSSESYVQTQIKLLQSSTLLDRTVERLKAEPHAQALDRDDLISRLRRTFHLSRGGDLPYDTLVDDAAKRIKVKPLGITRLVEVTCDSYNADFSARFCNRLVAEFKALDLETRASEAQKTSEWLSRQAADVREKAESAQKNLEAATGGDGLVLSQTSSNIGEDRLRQLQGELVHAQAERMDREAQARISASANPDSVAAVRDSPTYREEQQKLADLNTQIAALVPPLTEENPKVIHLRAQIREVEANMAQERASVLARVRNDFESARHHEDLLTASYAALQDSVSNEMSKTARVNLLRREVDGEQQLYQTLLQRAKEAGFASAMQASTIRVVDRAAPQKTPVSPRRGTATGVGILLGSFCGLGFAFFKDRSSSVFREPGEAERHLHVHELGVIPSASTGGRRVGQKLPALLTRGNGNADEAGESDSNALTCWGQNFSIVAEAYRNTTHSILLAGKTPRRSQVYTVTSPNAGEGKTTVSTNLGVALSKAKLRVVLIDGDLRKPGLHRSLLVENSFGLRNILRDEIDVSTAPIAQFCKQTLMPNLFIIPSGSGREEVVELLHAGSSITKLVDRLAREFDVVLIDTPPMLHMADARILAAKCDGVILVFRAGRTGRDQAASACDIFENDHVPIVGTILNDFNPLREGRTGYYESYYRYKDAIESTEAATAK